MTMTKTQPEIDMYRSRFEHEYETTIKVLRAYPAEKAGLKPVPSSQSAREIAWTLVLVEGSPAHVLRDDPMPKEMPQGPSDWGELLAAYAEEHAKSAEMVAGLTEEAMNATTRTMTGPKQEGDVRVGDMLWASLNMSIHHRGQLSVYLRIAGGKVPSIYGPSKDEPW
jgi:uncharacterized damage-inducible protein DinB